MTKKTEKKTSPLAAKKRSINKNKTELKDALIAVSTALVKVDRLLHFMTKHVPPKKRHLVKQQLDTCEHLLQGGTEQLRESIKLLDEVLHDLDEEKQSD